MERKRQNEGKRRERSRERGRFKRSFQERERRRGGGGGGGGRLFDVPQRTVVIRSKSSKFSIGIIRFGATVQRHQQSEASYWLLRFPLTIHNTEQPSHPHTIPQAEYRQVSTYSRCDIPREARREVLFSCFCIITAAIIGTGSKRAAKACCNEVNSAFELLVVFIKLSGNST